MDDLWQRVARLIGQDLPLVSSSGRSIQVIAVTADTVVVRGERRVRLAGQHADHQIPPADIAAAAQLGLHGAALHIGILDRRLRDLQQPGYTLAILRALEAADTSPAR